MRINLTIILFSFIFSATGQSNEIGIIPFKLERNPETHNRHFEPKFLTGIYYQKNFSRFHWITAVEYGVNSINDYCNSCVDHVAGEGKFKELSLNGGIGTQWYLPTKWGSFEWLTRLKAVGMAYNYSGNFSGGWCGTLHNSNQRYYLIGGELELGAAFVLPSNFVFRLDTGVRLGKVWEKNNFTANAPFIRGVSGAYILPKLSIGYRF